MSNSIPFDFARPGWWDYEDNDEDDFLEDDLDEEDFDCGWEPGEGCLMAGTEDCDFECPYRDMWERLETKKRTPSGEEL